MDLTAAKTAAQPANVVDHIRRVRLVLGAVDGHAEGDDRVARVV